MHTPGSHIGDPGDAGGKCGFVLELAIARLFRKYLMSTSFVPCTLLGIEHLVGNETLGVCVLMSIQSWSSAGEADTNQMVMFCCIVITEINMRRRIMS